MSSDKQINWIYEGPKSSVNCEDYLLGKKIDKNFELYSDVVKKDEDKIDEIARKRNDSDPEKVNCLKVESIVGEDPLVAIKVKQAKKEKAALENPVFKKKIEDYLRKKFEVVYQAQLRLEKIAKGLEDNSSESSDISNSYSEDERKKIYDRSRSPSPKRKTKRDYFHERYKNDDSEKKKKYKKDKDDDSDVSMERRRKYCDRINSHKDRFEDKKKRINEYERYSYSSIERTKNIHDERSSYKDYSPRERKYYDSHKNMNRHHRTLDIDRSRERKRDYDKNGRKQKSYFSNDKKYDKKPRMTAEEMEEKRREMVENAKWREDSRKKTLERATIQEMKEKMLEEKTRSNEAFKPKLL